MKKINIIFITCFMLILGLVILKIENKNEKFIDLINLAQLDKMSSIEVVIKLNYEDNTNIIKELNSVEENQGQIKKVRESNYQYYTNKNYTFLESINTNNFYVEISNYSPFIFILFDNYLEYISHKKYFINISKRDDVDKIYANDISEVVGDAFRETDVSEETLSISEIHDIINVDNASFTGAGIKVGIIDVGSPNNLTNFPNNQIKYTTVTQVSDHAAMVASLLGGTYGVASEAELYFHEWVDGDETSTTYVYNLKNSVEALLTEGVNVINMSVKTLNGVYGEMDYYAAYLDYIIWNNFVNIVKSSGNNGNLISSPGCGLNTIVVGSINKDLNVSSFSRFSVIESLEDKLMKPTLVAPGENIIIPNTIATAEDPTYGTSFSAPLVTGTIALLLEEYPNLMVYPEVIISGLINGATPLPSQTNHWDEHAGAGLLNYEGAREAIDQSTYSNQTVTSTTNLDNVLLSEVIDIEPNETAEFSFLNLVTHGVITPQHTTMIPVFSKFDVKVYDSNGDEVNVTKYGENSNTIVGTITNTHTSTVRYRVKVAIRGNKVSMYDEKIILMIYYHNSHDYKYTSISDLQHIRKCLCWDTIQESHQHTNSYIKVDNTNHKSYCICGHSIKEGHVVTTPNPSYCIICRSSISVITPSPLNNIYKTHMSINGSYILSNGLIVLVEDDVEAYLSGILQFNKYNVNSEIK